MVVTNKSLIGEILEQDNTTAKYFIEIGMHCLGCPSAKNETVEQACMVNGQDVNVLLEKLNNHFNG